MNYYTRAFKKYAVFSGRASRAEFWYFFLFSIIVSGAISIVDRIIGLPRGDNGATLGNLYGLIVLVPGLAIGWRRMHDINKNGWFSIIPIYNLFLFARKGNEGANKYGDDPKKELA